MVYPKILIFSGVPQKNQSVAFIASGRTADFQIDFFFMFSRNISLKADTILL